MLPLFLINTELLISSSAACVSLWVLLLWVSLTLISWESFLRTVKLKGETEDYMSTSAN